ncbi:hypothetical protein EYF80_028358 [Liparis tanakae]|uniref:Uncharacterized protein n=1 Tax=Liparis tanakae TaxID=230148 RepID=A0A4Z2H6R8_9TELE|nr:hypothetical protein EYF80_028358 [Liparis tanakae]
MRDKTRLTLGRLVQRSQTLGRVSRRPWAQGGLKVGVPAAPSQSAAAPAVNRPSSSSLKKRFRAVETSSTCCSPSLRWRLRASSRKRSLSAFTRDVTPLLRVSPPLPAAAWMAAHQPEKSNFLSPSMYRVLSKERRRGGEEERRRGGEREVDLLHLAVLQVGVQGGAHQSEPAHLGGLQVQAVFTPQAPDALERQLEERLCSGRDEALQGGRGGRQQQQQHSSRLALPSDDDHFRLSENRSQLSARRFPVWFPVRRAAFMLPEIRLHLHGWRDESDSGENKAAGRNLQGLHSHHVETRHRYRSSCSRPIDKIHCTAVCLAVRQGRVMSSQTVPSPAACHSGCRQARRQGTLVTARRANLWDLLFPLLSRVSPESDSPYCLGADEHLSAANQQTPPVAPTNCSIHSSAGDGRRPLIGYQRRLGNFPTASAC